MKHPAPVRLSMRVSPGLTQPIVRCIAEAQRVEQDRVAWMVDGMKAMPVLSAALQRMLASRTASRALRLNPDPASQASASKAKIEDIPLTVDGVPASMEDAQRMQVFLLGMLIALGSVPEVYQFSVLEKTAKDAHLTLPRGVPVTLDGEPSRMFKLVWCEIPMAVVLGPSPTTGFEDEFQHVDGDFRRLRVDVALKNRRANTLLVAGLVRPSA